MKIIVTMLVGGSIVLSLMLLVYKPVFNVSLKDKDLGYVKSKLSMQYKVNEYLQYGDADNIGYILLEESPKYEFRLIKKEIETNEDQVLASIKSESEVYYKVYAVTVDEKEVCMAETLEDAQKIVDGVNEKQKNYKKKSTISVVEKYEKEYSTENVEVAIANIYEPIKKENDRIVSIQNKPSSGKTVSAGVLASLKASTKDLNFSIPISGGGVITSRYGWRRGGSEYHTGLDLAADIGTPIHVAEDGVVTCAKWSGNYGYLVKVQHVGGYETYYAHCSKFNVKVGDEVHKGDVVAYVGSTGRSTGPHVHLEIRLNGRHMNPQSFL
jgi:murein DD-endopeptidase MepM/ murein hydrolase activator NlpD